jgi:flagellar protein FliS
MASYSRTNYRETEILTAPPQKLRLMLIQAAIRSIEQARQHWHAGNHEQGFETLVHSQEIVTELISGINPEVDNEITRKAAAIYLFIFRCLVEANFQHSEAKLDDALRVLREEQETWRLLCEKLGDNGNHSAVNVSLKEAAGQALPPVSAPVLNLDLPAETTGGFSLEA